MDDGFIRLNGMQVNIMTTKDGPMQTIASLNIIKRNRFPEPILEFKPVLLNAYDNEKMHLLLIKIILEIIEREPCFGMIEVLTGSLETDQLYEKVGGFGIMEEYKKEFRHIYEKIHKVNLFKRSNNSDITKYFKCDENDNSVIPVLIDSDITKYFKYDENDNSVILVLIEKEDPIRTTLEQEFLRDPILNRTTGPIFLYSYPKESEED